MSVVSKLLIVGGGLALGLVASGVAASIDQKRMKSRFRSKRILIKPKAVRTFSRPVRDLG